MVTQANAYQFRSAWRLPASEAEVYNVLADPMTLVHWWPSVYLDVRVVHDRSDREPGHRVDVFTKGLLPYTLRWSFRCVERRFPNRLVLRAKGDLDGEGMWKIRQSHCGEFCDVGFDWNIMACKPLLRHLSFLLKPIFAFNHHWAMRRGEESIQLELRRRRRASSGDQCLRIGNAPGPSFPHNVLCNKVF